MDGARQGARARRKANKRSVAAAPAADAHRASAKVAEPPRTNMNQHDTGEARMDARRKNSEAIVARVGRKATDKATGYGNARAVLARVAKPPYPTSP